MRGQTAAWRWPRGWWPDRNPLRHQCDRAETALVTALVAEAGKAAEAQPTGYGTKTMPLGVIGPW